MSTKGDEAGAERGGFPSSEEKRYFEALEDLYFDLVEASNLLSADDYQIARGWYRKGIPLEHVRSCMERVLAKRRESGRDDPLGLRYHKRAVESAWKEIEAMRAAGEREEAPGLDVPARLRALAAALPEGLPEREAFAERVAALSGDTEHVEAALAQLDHEVLARAEEGLGDAERAEVDREVEDTVSSLFGRLFAGDVDKARGRLRRQALRRQLGLPVLSLFSPEAERGEEEGGAQKGEGGGSDG